MKFYLGRLKFRSWKNFKVCGFFTFTGLIIRCLIDDILEKIGQSIEVRTFFKVTLELMLFLVEKSMRFWLGSSSFSRCLNRCWSAEKIRYSTKVVLKIEEMLKKSWCFLKVLWLIKFSEIFQVQEMIRKLWIFPSPISKKNHLIVGNSVRHTCNKDVTLNEKIERICGGVQHLNKM